MPASNPAATRRVTVSMMLRSAVLFGVSKSGMMTTTTWRPRLPSSTDIVALDDVEVAGALQFIHSQAATSICINDVVRRVHISRRALEMRFQKTLGRTIRAEIQRNRLDRAKQLLLESDMPMPKIAAAVGFNTASYFGQVFRQQVGMTPARYRATLRAVG